MKQVQDDLKRLIDKTRASFDMITDKAGDEVVQRDFMVNRPTLDINIDEISIQVLNYSKKYVVLLDQNSAKFFQHRIQAACDGSDDHTDHSLGSLPSPTDVGTDMSGTDWSAGCSFEEPVLSPHGHVTSKI